MSNHAARFGKPWFKEKKYLELLHKYAPDTLKLS